MLARESKDHGKAAASAAEPEKRPYVFPGVWPFAQRIAEETGRDLHQLGRTRSIWHVSRIQDALGQIPQMPPEVRAEAMEHVHHAREGLALALEGVDAAIAEVAAECGIAPPARAKGAKK